MKPQTSAFIGKSHDLLAQADKMLEVGLTEAAGRTAYLAALHAAHALIFERTGKVFTSHKGVQRELGWLTKSEPRFHPDLRAFLARAYHLKDIADYETGPEAKISADRARNAIQTARRFTECVAAILPPNDQTPIAPDAPEP